jgi:hypothetical protein
MANSLDAFIPELWANESVAILVENMVIANLIHRDFSNEVASFGDVVNTRKPAEFTAKRKTDSDDVTVQDASATNIQVPLNQHLHTSFTIKDGEETKSFKMLRDEYLQPALLSIAQAIDKCILGMSHSFYMNGVGLVGLTSSNVKDYIIDARKKLNVLKAPEQGRNLILTPNVEGEALKLDTFHEADKVGDNGTALREASLGRKFGFNMFMCQNAPSIVAAPVSASTTKVDLSAGYAIGDTTLHVDTKGDHFNVGQWVSVDGQAPGIVTAIGTISTQDQDITLDRPLSAAVADDDLVVTGDTGLINQASGSPTGYAAGYAKKIVVDGITGAWQVGMGVKFSTAGSPNVLIDGEYSIIEVENSSGNTIGITLNRPLDVAVLNNDVVAVTPNAEHCFAFHRNAIAMVSRPLSPAPRGLALSAVASVGGIGVRVTITYNGTSQGVLVTVDLLFGLAVLDEDLGVPLIG